MYAKAHIVHKAVWNRVSSRVLFYIFALILVSVCISYAILLNKTIMNVVAREKTERTIASLSGTIGELEFTYMNKRGSVTLDLAYSKGFRDATPSQFIPRNSQEVSYNVH